MSLTWTDMQKKRLQGAEENVPWWVNDKLRLHKFCADAELPMPKIYATWNHPGDIDLASAPDQFVLKPSVMHSAWGVMVLERLPGTGEFRESLSGRVLSAETIIKEQIAVYERCKYKGSYKIFTEERVTDETLDGGVPYDYKVFCYYDRAMMVQQINRNVSPKQFAWFDGDFEPLVAADHIESDWTQIEAGPHVKPHEWARMLEVAVAATRLLKTPFMSVDMFNSNRGPLIGELTPAPGGPYYGDWYRFTPEYNQELGEAWLRAQTELERDQESR